MSSLKAVEEAQKPSTKKRDLVEPTSSSLGGVGGAFETLLRRFRSITHAVALLPLYALGCLILGTALIPGVWFFHLTQEISQAWPFYLRYPAFAVAIATGYHLYGFSMIFIVPLMNIVMFARLKPWRGPYYSLQVARWYIHNGLTYLVRYTFLEFITPTPFNIFFYRMMGMKIGRGVQINSTHISDPSLIQLGDKVTIGGSAVLMAHYGVSGYLIISPVIIDNGATIGLRATIMAGARIGENAVILPNSVVLPKTVVPAGETWGGVPAVKIERKSPTST